MSANTEKIEKTPLKQDGLESLRGSKFRELLASEAGVEQLVAFLKQRKSLLEDTYKNLGYSDKELKTLNASGQLREYINVREKLNSLLRFLSKEAIEAVRTSVAYDETVLDGRYREWGTLDVQYRNVLADVNSLPQTSKIKDVLPTESKAERKEPSKPPKSSEETEEELESGMTLSDAARAMQKEMDTWGQGAKTEAEADFAPKAPEVVQTPEPSVTVAERSNESFRDAAHEIITQLEQRIADAIRKDVPADRSTEIVKELNKDLRFPSLKTEITNLLDSGVTLTGEEAHAIADKVDELRMIAGETIRRIRVLVGEQNIPEVVAAEPIETGFERGGSTYEEVRAQWKEARDNSDTLEKAYQEKLHEYYKDMETKKMFGKGGLVKAGYEAHKLLGLKPRLTPELNSLYAQSVHARNEYKKYGAELVLAKYAGKGGHGLTVSKRYEQMLAEKVLVSPMQKRNDMQENVIKEVHPNGTQIQKVLERWRKTRTWRIAGMVGVYGLIGLVTGGVGAAAIGGGGKLLRITTATVAGKFMGQAMSKLLDVTIVAKAQEQYEETKISAKSSLFDPNKDFESLERNISAGAARVAHAQWTKRAIASSVAGLAGFAAGASSAGAEHSISAGVLEQPSINPPTPGAVGDISTVSRDIETHSDGELNQPLIPPTPGAVFEDSLAAEHPEPVTAAPIMPTGSAPETAVPSAIPVPDRVVGGTPPPYAEPSAPEMTTSAEAEQLVREAERLGAETDNIAKELGGISPEHAMPYEPGGGTVSSEIPSVVEPTVEPSVGASHLYEVQKTDTKGLWNIMEGSGPDTHPVGGQSEVLRDMPRVDRNRALDTLFDYMHDHPEFTKEVGISDPSDPRFIIHPGDKINIGLMDEKLKELLGADTAHTADISNTNLHPDAVPTTELPHADNELPGRLSDEYTVEPSPRAGIDDFQKGDSVGRDEFVSHQNSEQFGQAVDTARGTENVTDPSAVRGQSEVTPIDDPSLRVDDAPNSRIGVLSDEYVAPETSGHSAGDALPHANENVPPVEGNTMIVARDQMIAEIEKPKGGFFGFGGTDIRGTYAKMESLPLKTIVEIQNMEPRFIASRLAQMGVSQNGWDTWIDAVNDNNTRVPANMNETFGQYMSRVAGEQQRAA